MRRHFHRLRRAKTDCILYFTAFTYVLACQRVFGMRTDKESDDKEDSDEDNDV